ncbi:hypothetical protein PybrP1_009934, partial [[Pythium] brassicae (nom. inval.)]
EIHPTLAKIRELDPQERYFSFDLCLTRPPTEAVMDQPVDHERLSGKRHVTATRYSTEITKKVPQPFAEPLRSRASKSLMYLTTFFVVTSLYVYSKYGEKIRTADNRLAYLQAAAEILLLFCAAFVVYAHVLVDKCVVKKVSSRGWSAEKNLFNAHELQTPVTPRVYLNDVHTYRDLLNEYGVTVGSRPDMKAIINRVFEAHQIFSTDHPSATGNKTVGVFISGPGAMKSATEHAVADLGSSHFDLHEEEFEFYHRRLVNARVAAAKSKKPISTDKYLDMWGNSLGFSCLFNLAFLLIPATRNSAFMEVLGISYANGVKYHRWLGVFTVLFAVLHCIPYYWKWARKDKLLHESFPCFNCSIKDGEEGHERWVTFFGELALLCFLAMSFSAIPYVRRNFFNVFYYVHHLFFIALVFVVLHWAGFVWFLLAPVLGYLMSRFLSTSNSFTAVQVTEFTSLSGEFVKIVVSRSALRDGDFQVGKFVYINVPAVSQLQWHPFSVASSPRSSATSLTLIMKSLGDWTNAVTEYCDECKKNNTLPTVYLDGYYGSSYEFYEDYSTVCLVAGGVGVTPLLAILNDMVAKIVDREQLHQKVYFIFTFRELSLLEELHPLLLKIRELDPEETYFSLVFSLTREPTESMLERKIDHERLHGFDNLTPTHNGDGSHKPFAVPLQSRATKSLVYVTVFALAVAVLVVIEYGGAGKIEEHNGELWAVQNFVEVVVIFVCALLVFGFVYLERKVLAKSKSSGATELSEKHPGDVGVVPFTSQLHAADIHTYRDLVAQYNVAIGPRLDLQSTLREVFSAHQTFVASHPSSAKDAAAGIFVSGPSSLKASVDEAVSAIDSSSFDIFTEEFQL